MKSLLIASAAILMSCASTTSSQQKLSDMEQKAELLVTSSQGGAERPGFRIIKDEKEYLALGKSGFQFVEDGKDPASHYPKFPKDKKVVVYNLGGFRSGSHTINEIKGVSVKNNVLYVEVPAGEPSGGMEIQVLSNPWFVFAVPADYQFTSVELKYSK
ncbi:hypothetical protein [Chryseobacterium bernardetii]|uniref:Protease complex subunit PrcB family protein n=1 Tax=Chryseobacterium bernardetii TaxID=1241978 RepID=A0A3G6U6H4_9FLAO|nr:hypothetical protein [Chryseobacterium bernardetii]AZB25232.1 hypothetical protein EG339_11900 [Chryseobacterium bernardetii]AZB35667.1 hypothetical protein EG351_20120 [Chryseobacterium bernardetii]